MDAVMADKEDILKEIKDRFKESYDASDENYMEAIHDLEFLGGDQWPGDLKADRQSDGRPCLVINKLPAFANQVIGDIRQNEPQIKVKPVDSKSDPETAEIMTGLIRNIEVQSNAEIAYDTAAESSVRCGMGAFRIGTEYSDDDSFEQDIRFFRIKNPFTVYWDPAAQAWDKSDARYCFVTEKIPKEDFQRLYPNASLIPFEGGKDRNTQWGDDKSIRVAEYFKKELEKKKLFLIRNTLNGETQIREEGPYNTNWEIVKEREVESQKIIWYKASQHEILEGPQDWPGKYIPIVMVYGDELNIENKTVYSGMVRNAKDPQRLYNYSRSSGAEIISLAPKAPYLVTQKQIGNYQKIWDQAHKRNFPYLPYDADPDNPAAIPRRAEPVSVNTGIQAEIMTADQEIHDTTGLQRASLGKQSNEKSGKAIIARQREGDVATFTYYDNLGRAVKHAGKILVDLIPKIYDTARVVRILNPDDSEQMVQVNKPFRDEKTGVEKIFDLTMGKYDVVVSIGPSYTTQREESAENMMAFIQAVPQAGPLIADLFAKNLDWPGAAEIEKRLKFLLPPALQADGEGGGPPPPPPSPDPMQLIEMRKKAAETQGKELDNQEKFTKMRMQPGGGENANQEG
uniref:Putative P22-like portal protein n=1 Tax=viral metagenome TaxID=1070528 RepID=A0A6M3KHY5_9ZZZZ